MADRKQYRVKFKTCEHDWELHVDLESCGGPASGNAVFQCENCGTFVTLLEKAALDSLLSQERSQIIQERSTRISMWANILAAGTLVVAAIVHFFGDKIIQYF
jgi:uncharacterized membrane protein YvbJ